MKDLGLRCRSFYGEDADTLGLAANYQERIEEIFDLEEPTSNDDENETEVKCVYTPKTGYLAMLAFSAQPESESEALLLGRAGLLKLSIGTDGWPCGLKVVNPTKDVGPIVEAAFGGLRSASLWEKLGLFRGS